MVPQFIAAPVGKQRATWSVVLFAQGRSPSIKRRTIALLNVGAYWCCQLSLLDMPSPPFLMNRRYWQIRHDCKFTSYSLID